MNRTAEAPKQRVWLKNHAPAVLLGRRGVLPPLPGGASGPPGGAAPPPWQHNLDQVGVPPWQRAVATLRYKQTHDGHHDLRCEREDIRFVLATRTHQVDDLILIHSTTQSNSPLA